MARPKKTQEDVVSKFAELMGESPLRGDAQKKEEGNFVLTGQKTAGEVGFSKVSQRWIDTTITYEQGLDLLEKGRAQTEDVVSTLQDMKPAIQGGHFVLTNKDGRSFRPTEHAVTQMGTWCGCGTWYVQSLLANPTNIKGDQLYSRDQGDAETLVHVLANGFRRIDPAKPFLWRTRKDGTLRAMLTTEYAKVDNRWFLETLRSIVPGGRLSHWKGDQDTLWGNILIPDSIRSEADSDYGGMLSIGNSEIGERRVMSLPSIFRAICQNGCIWGQEKGQGIRFVHRGKIDLKELFDEIRTNLQEQIPLLPQGIKRLLGIRSFGWDGSSMLPLFAQVAHEHKLSRKTATSLLTGFAEERAVAPDTARSLFGVVASVTRASQKQSNEEWFKLDSIGGRLSEYTKDEWSTTVKRAKSLPAKQVEEAFCLPN